MANGLVSCYHARFLEWLLNLGEKIVPSEDIGFIALSQGHDIEEATGDKHVRAGETETRMKICGVFSFKWFSLHVSCSYFGHCFCLELDFLND